jgi:hypothetical protein
MMNCERVATTMTTMARITERGDGGGGDDDDDDDANYRSSVQKQAKKLTSDERWEGNTQQEKTAKYLAKRDAYDASKRFKLIKPKQGRKTNPSFG